MGQDIFPAKVDGIQAVEEHVHPVHLHDLLKMVYLKNKLLDDTFEIAQDYYTLIDDFHRLVFRAVLPPKNLACFEMPEGM